MPDTRRPDGESVPAAPRLYAVNDRPVMIVALPDGGAEAVIFDLATGHFTPDPGAFARVSDSGPGKDVDSLSPERSDVLVTALREQVPARWQARPIAWTRTPDGVLPFTAHAEGHALSIRVNDFPAEPLYTLLVDNLEVADLEDWPAAWTKPPVRP